MRIWINVINQIQWQLDLTEPIHHILCKTCLVQTEVGAVHDLWFYNMFHINSSQQPMHAKYDTYFIEC